MKDWKLKIDVSILWEKRKTGKISLKELVEGIVKEFDKKEAIIIHKLGSDVLEELTDIIYGYGSIGFVDEITRNVMVTDEEEFDEVWNQIYDWADYNKVWIKTR